MPWLKTPGKPHVCQPPLTEADPNQWVTRWPTHREAGSVWMCPKCGNVYEVDFNGHYQRFNWLLAAWMRRRYRPIPDQEE